MAESESGRRLDVFLAEKLEGSSRALVQKYIEDEKHPTVRVNDSARKPNYRLRSGDLVAVNIPPPRETRLKPRRIALHVIYEDDDIIVINKQPGIPVHPGAGHGDDTITNALLYHTGKAGTLSNIGGENRPGIIHRLDKDTAGVLLVAKTNEAHVRLSSQFAMRDTEKIYEAIVKGRLLPAAGVIDRPIARSPYNRKKFAVREHGKEAITRYSVLEARGETSLVRFFPETGRTHQIRVHAASLGHPILGDCLYSRKAQGTKYIALFAKSLTISHPRTGERVTFTAPYPRHFRELADSLGYRLDEHADAPLRKPRGK